MFQGNLFNVNLNTNIIPSIKTMYTLDEIYNIQKTISSYELPELTLQLINKINEQVCSPNYIKTPIFKKKVYNNKKNINLDNDINIIKKKNKKNKNKDITDTEWEIVRNFESTKITKNEEGINKDLNIIRILLNKLCDDNYDDILFEIKYKMNNIIEYASQNDLEEIGKSIFEIGSHNRFYCKLYAKIYSDLIKDYIPMKKAFDVNYKNFYDIICCIESADPNTDYDKFCVINKNNETRRAVCAFISNLVNENIISVEQIYENISYFTTQFKNNINIDNNFMITDEIAEVLTIIIKECIQTIKTNKTVFENVSNIIDELSDLNVKVYPSLNNKILFKFMDLLDIIETIDESD